MNEKLVEIDVRKQYPGVGRAADYEKSRSAAIKGKCLSCCGNQRTEVENCRIYTCFLWPFRPYGDRVRPEDAVPTEEAYAAMTEGRGPSAETLQKLAEGRRKYQEARGNDELED